MSKYSGISTDPERRIREHKKKFKNVRLQDYAERVVMSGFKAAFLPTNFSEGPKYFDNSPARYRVIIRRNDADRDIRKSKKRSGNGVHLMANWI